MFARLANSSIICLAVPYTWQKMSSLYIFQTSGLVVLWLTILFFSIFVMKNILATAVVIAAPWVCEKQCCVPG